MRRALPSTSTLDSASRRPSASSHSGYRSTMTADRVELPPIVSPLPAPSLERSVAALLLYTAAAGL